MGMFSARESRLNSASARTCLVRMNAIVRVRNMVLSLVVLPPYAVRDPDGPS